MKLSELIIHVDMVKQMCQDKGIPTSVIDVYFVSDVLWRSETKNDSNKLLKNKRPITSIEVNAIQGKEFLFYEASSWEQLQQARVVK